MTVLVLHDLGHDRSQLASMLPPLPDVWAPDLPGHGANPEPAADHTDSLSVYEMARVVAIGMPPAASQVPLTVVGLGLGAAVGLRIVLAGVHRIDRFVAIRPSFGSQPMAPNLLAYPVLATLLETSPRDALQRFETSGVFNEVRAASEAAGAELRALAVNPRTQAHTRALFTAPGHPAFEPHEFAGFDVPTMVIADPTSPVHPLSVAHEWQTLMGAALRVTPERGRHPHAADAWIRQQLSEYLVGVR